ncbi:MAG: M24 family metallopeptidase [Candidatus Lokiarchaeota archaeon]|nr:M24 family metallopeptidase [Candidatus Lokiarchaeota archaeon]MBD3338615.1 M24 family metallopeptidase [Candidatus Lokiarchaeota archaeon]
MIKLVEPIGYSKERASKILDKYDIDLLIASTPVNVFYTTGLITTHVAPNPILYVLQNQYPFLSMIRRDGEESAIVWALYDSVEEFSWVDPSEVYRIGTLDAAVKTLINKVEDGGFINKKIGLESFMPRFLSDALKTKFPDAKYVDGDNAFIDMRLIKTEEEVRRIKKSTEVAEKAIKACIDATELGVPDTELLKIARRTIVDEGAWGWDHLTMNIGPSDPEAPGLGIPVTENDIVRFDFGAVWEGYISDVSRGVVIGEEPKKAKKAMDYMIQVQDFCVDNVKPGINAKDLMVDAKKYLKDLTKRGFYLITGHSIGLECEEAHIFGMTGSMDIPFEKNMVLDIEVWVNVRGQGLVGVEDCYRVTDSGCERLSSLDKETVVK